MTPPLNCATSTARNEQLVHLEKNGYCLLPQIFSNEQVNGMVAQLEIALANAGVGISGTVGGAKTVHSAIHHRSGGIYAARGLLQIAPFVRTCWRVPALVQFVHCVLGHKAGLVRALFFDKPPGVTWALPWHKDLKIALSDDCQPDATYSSPRPRDGILHTEPPTEVLDRMLTLRIHLDANTESNGPLEVLPGGHLTGKTLRVEEFMPVKILSAAGDVLAMRPLLPHASCSPHAGTNRNRRILHLEFAADQFLPGGASWHDFLAFDDDDSSKNNVAQA